MSCRIKDHRNVRKFVSEASYLDNQKWYYSAAMGKGHRKGWKKAQHKMATKPSKERMGNVPSCSQPENVRMESPVSETANSRLQSIWKSTKEFLLPKLKWTSANVPEILEDVLHSPLFNIVLCCILFVLAVSKAVTMAVAIAIALAWFVTVYGVARWRRIKGLSPKIRLLITVGCAVVLFFPARSFDRWAIKQAMPNPTKGEREQLTNFVKHLPQPQKMPVEQSPAFSLQVLLRLHNLPEKRRKYLFDFGKSDKDRLSLYLSESNVLTFSLLDDDGEPAATHAILGNDSVPLDEFIYLACDVIISDESTKIRFSVNGRDLDAQIIPVKVDFGQLWAEGWILGADLGGQNGASFDVFEVVGFNKTLTDEDVRYFIDYFSDRSRQMSSYVEFRGHQWMKHGPGGLHQEDKRFQPTYRKF